MVKVVKVLLFFFVLAFLVGCTLKNVKNSDIYGLYQLEEKFAQNPQDLNVEDLTKLALIYKMEGKYEKSYTLLKKTVSLLSDKNYYLAEIYLYLMSYLSDKSPFEKDYIRFLSKLTKKTDKYYISDLSKFLLFNIYKVSGKFLKAKRCAQSLGFVNKWFIIGPFKNESRSGMSIVAPPEVEINFDKIYTEGTYFPVKWRIIYQPGNAKINLKNYFTPDESVFAYLLTFVKVTNSGYYHICLGTDDGFKLWINDKLIAEEDIYRSAYFDQNRFKVFLRKGVNKVLLKITQEDSDWEIYFRITPTNYSIVTDKEALHQYLKEKGKERVYKVIRESTFPDYHKKLKFFKNFFLGYYYFFTGNYSDTNKLDSEYFTKAIKYDSKEFKSLYYYYYAISSDTKESKEKYLKKAVDLFQGNEEAKLRLSTFYMDNSLYKPAFNILNNIINENPQFYIPYFFRGKLFYKTGLFNEAEKDFNKCLNNGYYSDNVLIYLGNIYWQKKMYNIAGGYFLNSFKINPLNFELSNDSLMIQYLNWVGKRDKILRFYKKIIQGEGGSPEVYNNIAEYYLYNKNPYKSLTFISNSLKIDPYNPDTLKLAADIQLEVKNTNQAIKCLKRILDVKPNQKNIERRIRYLTGKTESIVDKYKPDVDGIIKKIYSRGLNWYKEKYSDNGIIYYDGKIIKVAEDGSKETLVTAIYYIIRESGIKDFKTEQVNYDPDTENVEILYARTFARDGKKIDSNEFKTYSLIGDKQNLYYSYFTKVISFSDVQVDRVILFQYRVWSRKKNPLEKSYFGDISLFGDFHPILKKEFFLIVPKRLKIYYRYKNFSKKPKLKKYKKKLYKIYYWQQKNLFRLKYEPNMESPYTVVPQIYISTFKKWSEIAKWMNNLITPQNGINSTMKDIVDNIKKVSSSTDEIIEKIYNYVKDNIRYVGIEYGIGSIRPRNAISVFSSGFGDCKDKANLLMNLLHYAGIDAYMGLVRTSQKGKDDFALPLLSLFDHAICVAFANNKMYRLDATTLYYRYDEFPYYDSWNSIFLIKDKGKFIKPPKRSYKDNQFEANTEGEIFDKYDLKIKRTITAKGQFAANFRYFNFDRNYHKKYVENAWNSYYPGSRLLSFNGYNIESSTPSFEYNVVLKNFFKPIKNGVKFDAVLNKSDIYINYFTSQKRNYDFIINYPYTTTEKTTYSLKGLKINKIILPKNVDIKSKWIDLSIKYERDNDTVKVAYELCFKKARLSPNEYKKARKIALKIKRAEDAEIEVITE